MATSKINHGLPQYKYYKTGENTTILSRGMWLYVFGTAATNIHRNGLVLVTVRGSSETAAIVTIGGDLSHLSVTDDGYDSNGRKIKVAKESYSGGSIPCNIYYLGDTA